MKLVLVMVMSILVAAPFADAAQTKLENKNTSGYFLSETNQPVEGQPGPDRSDVNSMSKFNVWRSVGAIIFILAGLLAANAFLKKRYPGFSKTAENQHIKVLEKFAIDHRRNLLLVEVDDRRILLGIGPEHIDSLATLGREGQEDEEKPTP